MRVAVHDLGGPGDSSVPVLLFSHATGFCGGVWEPMASHLTAQYRCYAIDYRGHGLAETPEGTSLAWSGMGDDALAVLESDLIGPDRAVHGVAHSMGGAALVLAAARHPGAFRSLWLYEPVIIPPGALPSTHDTNPMAAGAARRRESFESYEDAFANFASKPPLNQLHPDALRAYVECGFALQPDGTVILRCRPATEAAVFEAAVDSGAWEAFATLELPVAIIAGRPEPVGPVAFASMAVDSLSHAILIGRPELGHFGPLEDPSSMAHDVEDWVEANQ